MNTVLAVIAAVAALVGLILLFLWRRAGRELALMQATPISRAAEVGKAAPDTFVGMKGPLKCDAPLICEFSKQKCIYYRAVIEREYERTTRDSQGRTHTERQRETVQSNERFAPCALDDGSGRVAIDFTGADVEAVEAVRRFEPAAGNIVGAVVGGLLGGNRDIGLYYIESIIAPDMPVYVLGTVRAAGVVGASPGKKNPFVVSHKSEEERERDFGRKKLFLMIGAVLCFALAAGLLIAAIKTGH